MALKFLNKKGWHTGSLRNIENVWKAEQKHEAEQKKLDELRKQIQEERERSEFRLLQEQAGLIPKQERLDFLYDSGLAVGKDASTSDKGGAGSGSGSGSGFKALEGAFPTTNNDTSSSSTKLQSSAPGALFEDKPHSANDAWRKLHSDPLLLIRQREQEALARVKNNPVQMSIIRKSVEEKIEKKKHKEKSRDKKEHRKKHHHSSSKHHRSSKQQSDSEDVSNQGEKRIISNNHKRSNYGDHYYKTRRDSENEPSERESGRKNNHGDSKNPEWSPNGVPQRKIVKNDYHDATKSYHDKSKRDKYSSTGRSNVDNDRKERENAYDSSSISLQHESHHKRRNVAPKLSEEERAARLLEMQVDAELHEEQRWKRLRKAEEEDAREATRASISGGRTFLDAAHKSVYGAEKGGSSTIEESVRRRTHYLQGRSEAGEGNAFRR